MIKIADAFGHDLVDFLESGRKNWAAVREAQRDKLGLWSRRCRPEIGGDEVWVKLHK